MKPRLRRILRNPMVVMTPVVLVAWFGWHSYTLAGKNFGSPLPGQNLLQGTDWHGAKTGKLTYSLHQVQAIPGGPSYQLAVSNYQWGDANLSSSRLGVKLRTRYLFKSYYESNVSATMLARVWYGGSRPAQLIRLNDYPSSSSYATASYAFDSSDQITAIQYIFQLAGNGDFTLSDFYFEPDPDVAVADSVQSQTNLIPNPDLQPGAYDMPDQWSTFQMGTGNATFSYLEEDQTTYLAAQLQNYQNGQIKWQYVPQPATPFASYNFAVQYHGTAFSQIVAEYDLVNGRKQFTTLASLAPTSDWTLVNEGFQAPAGASDMFVSVILSHNGMVATRGYQLGEAVGQDSWSVPMASVTFNAGLASDSQIAAQVLTQDGFSGTFYVNPATIETPGHMTAVDLQSLSEAGDEIASAGYYCEDLTTVSTSRLIYDLAIGQNYLAEGGFKPTDLAAPFGKTDSQVSWYARKYYRTLESSKSGLNTAANFDPYNLLIMPVSSATTPAQIGAALGQAKEAHGWLILAYTNVTSSLSSQLAAVASSHVAIKTVAQALAMLNQPSPTPLTRLAPN